jgi:hypothetical protein
MAEKPVAGQEEAAVAEAERSAERAGEEGGRGRSTELNISISPPPAPTDETSPLQHKKALLGSIARADGRCLACGRPAGDPVTCGSCKRTPDSWNAEVGTFERSLLAAGRSARDIQDAWERGPGQELYRGLAEA